MEITLKGLTWDHPRGYAPLAAGAAEYEQNNSGVRVHWERRSLREFGEAPIEQYADRYDLIVVDHPFVGFAAAHQILVNLSPLLNEEEKLNFQKDSVGPSWPSYWYKGGLWALPLDAATQVACYRPDWFEEAGLAPPATFDDVLRLGTRAASIGKCVIVPACPTDAISLFFTVSASLGHPIAEEAEPFVTSGVGLEVLRRLHALIAVAHGKSVDWNPIQVYDFMSKEGSALYCPFGFGYSNYSRPENRVRLQFVDAPVLGEGKIAHTMLGGTGIAVSAHSRQRSAAVAYAKWLASPQHQRGTYFREGGQPASLAAWTDEETDRAAGNFFSGTLRTLQAAYLRPRFNGFVRFFEGAGVEINRCLRGEVSDAQVLAWLNERYARQLAESQRVTKIEHAVEKL
jgi:multiple sugar transport system substrate-binding protein